MKNITYQILNKAVLEVTRLVIEPDSLSDICRGSTKKSKNCEFFVLIEPISLLIMSQLQNGIFVILRHSVTVM